MDSILNKHRDMILSVLKSRQKDIERSLKELPLFLEWKEVMDAINEIELQEKVSVSYHGSFIVAGTSVYNNEWSLSRKAEFILKQHGSGLGTGEIADKILEKEPAFNRSVLVSQISAVLGVKCRANKTFSRRPRPNNESEFIYELKEWNKAQAIINQPHYKQG